MNRIKDDRRESGETWAHYIKRGIGTSNFNVLDTIGDQPIEIALSSYFDTEMFHFSVAEVIHREDNTTLAHPNTHIYIARNSTTTDEKGEIVSITIYPDNTVEIDEYDPTAIPPDAKASFEQYRREEDIQRLADDIVTFARGLLDKRYI